mgnify:CR=1 FL=1
MTDTKPDLTERAQKLRNSLNKSHALPFLERIVEERRKMVCAALIRPGTAGGVNQTPTKGCVGVGFIYPGIAAGEAGSPPFRAYRYGEINRWLVLFERSGSLHACVPVRRMSASSSASERACDPRRARRSRGRSCAAIERERE